MMRPRHQLLEWPLKIVIFVGAFLLVLWVQIGFKFHFTDYIRYLFFTNDWLTIVLIMGFGLLLGKILEFLLIWVFHQYFVRRR